MNQNYYQDENQSSLPSHPSTAPAVLLKNTNNIIKLFDTYVQLSPKSQLILFYLNYSFKCFPQKIYFKKEENFDKI